MKKAQIDKLLEKVREVTLPADFYSLIDDLQCSDGLTGSLVIYNCDLSRVLEAMGLAVRNTRGSYYGRPTLRSLCKRKGISAVRLAVIEFCKGHNIRVFEEKVIRKEIK